MLKKLLAKLPFFRKFKKTENAEEYVRIKLNPTGIQMLQKLKNRMENSYNQEIGWNRIWDVVIVNGIKHANQELDRFDRSRATTKKTQLRLVKDKDK